MVASGARLQRVARGGTRVRMIGAASILRGKLVVVWMALMLNALAPVFAYAHIHLGANGEILEHCAADESEGSGAHDHHHSHSKVGAVPHCSYCPGFSAGAALAQGAVALLQQGERPAPPVDVTLSVPTGRSSVRIAQPRGPPSFS